LIIPNVQCMFIMTGCESPSVCRFIREMQADGHNIEIVKPRKTLREVFAECGFPLVSKNVAHQIEQVRRQPDCETSRKFLDRFNKHRIPERWLYLVDEPYDTSAKCCYWLKKTPGYEYEKRTGRHPYIGLLASESDMRAASYLRRGGCNSFTTNKGTHSASWPLAIWTEADVWQYIRDRGLQLPDIYEKGATRTGCMGCGFGAHIHDEGLTVMQNLWPRWYNMVMDYENNGIRYGEAIDKMMSHGHRFNKKLSRSDPRWKQ